jgi:hypothetical protein
LNKNEKKKILFAAFIICNNKIEIEYTINHTASLECSNLVYEEYSLPKAYNSKNRISKKTPSVQISIMKEQTGMASEINKTYWDF